MMNIKKGLLVISCWLLAIGFGLLFLYLFQFFDIEDLASSRDLEIKTGMSFNEIADKLKAENLIRSKIIFKIYSLIAGQAHQFKPGRYILVANISIPKLVKALTEGPEEVSAMIAPGMTLKEIDDKLSSLNIIRPNDLVNLDINFLKNDYPWLSEAETFEGFLLPDTYKFFLGSDSILVARKFLENFKIKALPIFKNSNNILGIINLASLLEKEIPDYSERQLAAGILIKRLAIGMPLQVDATLLYNKCTGRFFNCPLLEKKDFSVDSPYSTYLRIGLPKGPICNPGTEAFKAALNPQPSDYWYYLSDPKTKKTIFSKTLDEHNKNRAIYLLKK